MSELTLTVAEIKELMDKMARTGLTALEITDGSFSLALRSEHPVVVSSAEAPAAVLPSSPAPEVPSVPEGNVVKSPLVGTYYAKPAPDKPDFVAVGQTVKKGDTLFIVESMKLMNEIQSEFSGTVREILVKNGQAVEFGQPILTIE